MTVIHLSCPKTKAFWYRLLKEMLLPDMPIAFNPIDEAARDEDVGGGPYFGYCNVPRLTSNLPLPDLWVVNPLTCGKGCTPFSETDHRKDQAIFLGRPTGEQTRQQCGHGHAQFMRCLIHVRTHHAQEASWTLLTHLVIRSSQHGCLMLTMPKF